LVHFLAIDARKGREGGTRTDESPLLGARMARQPLTAEAAAFLQRVVKSLPPALQSLYQGRIDERCCLQTLDWPAGSPIVRDAPVLQVALPRLAVGLAVSTRDAGFGTELRFRMDAARDALCEGFSKTVQSELDKMRGSNGKIWAFSVRHWSELQPGAPLPPSAHANGLAMTSNHDGESRVLYCTIETAGWTLFAFLDPHAK
jgi:hypothetical protein